MKPRNAMDIAAARYGRRWVIGVFVLWLIVFEIVAGQLYGWKTPATGHTTGRSALVLVIGCIAAYMAGKRAERRYRRVHNPSPF